MAGLLFYFGSVWSKDWLDCHIGVLIQVNMATPSSPVAQKVVR
ncbi:hypothetical protein [Salinisphaera sp. T5B8]